LQKWLLFKIFLPQLSLALEYQGETHYFSTHIFGRASDRKEADQIKVEFARQIGITVIPVPFWWDGSPESLAATIIHYRPDITFPGIVPTSPISSEIPVKYQKPFKYVPNSATEYYGQIDPTGWYVGLC
jgi:hypothetical protein